ncbi:MAG TPA: YhjD/YihY/BrkB family envelope integrity protein [Solirubrobacteraceae bacterium]
MSIRGLSDRGQVVAARARAKGESAARRINELRPRIPALDAAFMAGERDSRSGGSVLAGALAFRLFVPLLPFALLVVAILGYATSEDAHTPASISQTLGMREAALTSIADSAKLTNGDRIGVIAFGLFALITASLSAVRALRAIHALAWGLPLGRFPRALPAAMAFIGWGVVFFGIWALSGWARQTLGPAGIPVAIALLGGFFVLWVAVSRMLPHPPGLSWRAFIPGAILVAVGMEGIHLATVLYISHKAEQVSASYGALGISLVLLLWLYLLGRLIVASAFLNATLWERHSRRESS